MLPPITRQPPPFNIDANAPLTRWQQLDSYDSAAECNQDRTHRGLAVLKPHHREGYKWEDAQIISSLCIASDDLRLKAK